MYITVNEIGNTYLLTYLLTIVEFGNTSFIHHPHAWRSGFRHCLMASCIVLWRHFRFQAKLSVHSSCLNYNYFYYYQRDVEMPDSTKYIIIRMYSE